MSDSVPLIAGFVKLRNEIIRSSNVYRCLHNMQEFCDEIFVACDASWDGTDEYVKSIIPEDHIIQIAPEDQDFTKELQIKQQLIDLIHHHGPYEYIFWQDGDEVLDAKGTAEIRDFCRANLNNTKIKAWTFHYIQIWRNSSHYRLDDQFNDGQFLKLWRYNPELGFNIVNGTHNAQFPHQLFAALTSGGVEKAPWEVIHYGNYGSSLKWKCIQYYGGLGGVERHMNFESATYGEMDKSKFPSGAEHAEEVEPLPVPFSEEYKEKLLKLKNLKDLEKTFCIILPTNNRAHTLKRAIDSVLAQTHQDWILVVLDDASTDNTESLVNEYQEQDPRIFYCKYLEHRGGVAMNEIGMNIAINTCEWWSRLGSDDWWEPNKLELDAKAFEAGYEAVYGCFRVNREGVLGEIGNYPESADIMLPIFKNGGFFASWANVAVKCLILNKIKEKFGHFVNPQLINMEDLQLNARVSMISKWTWRGTFEGTFICNPTSDQIEELRMFRSPESFGVEGYWNANPIGASASGDISARDQMLSIKLINEDSLKFSES